MLSNLTFVDLRIPFKIKFKHNSAKRTETQSIIIIAETAKNKGYGEGCPREYVTNESLSSALLFFDQLKKDIVLQVHDLSSLIKFKNEKHALISSNHAIWCAIELALLDVFAKEKKCSVEHLLNLQELGDKYQYSAIIGDGSLQYFTEVAQKHLQIGFTDFKIKISGNKENDFEKFELLQKLCAHCSIRLDANNLWKNVDEALDYINQIPVAISAIEEPLASKNIAELTDLSNKIQPNIILDESFSNIEQIEEIKDLKKPFVINLRVSKMGGILNSLAIVEACKKYNIPITIGAQVGETSILTRAALLITNALKPIVPLQEGAYGTLLLERDIAQPSLMFGENGILEPQNLLHENLYGFQLNIIENFES